MISQVILIYDDDPEPIHCDDLLSLQTSKPPESLLSLEARVDTRDRTLSSLGDQFPQLRKLRLNNSIIPSVRDIGCTLSALRFLSLAHCNLVSLDGIATISQNLEELYLAFNRLTDVCDLMGMERLAVLDLEGNLLANVANVEILGFCPKLKALTLARNPAAGAPDYRSRVQELLPQLVYLDEKRIVRQQKKSPPIPIRAPNGETVVVPRLQIPVAVDDPESEIVTEQINDVVTGRPPSARGFSGALEKGRGSGGKRAINPSGPRIVRPASAKGKQFS
jgi:hypothetical protein